jgi:hypothetical protein
VVSVFIPAASQNFDAVSTCSVLSSLSGVEWKGANLHADNPAVSVLLVVVLSRNSTKSQRGQIHDYRSLSVPQLSPAAGRVIYSLSKPLIIVNSVMVVLLKRREMVTHLPTRFHAVSPWQARRKQLERVHSLIHHTSRGRLYYPERCPYKKTFWLRLRSLSSDETPRQFMMSSV